MWFYGREIMKLSKCYSFTKFRVFSAAVIGVAFGLSGWAASTGIVLAQDYAVINPVMLVPQGIGENLKVDKDPQCRENRHPGCLLFRQGELGNIVFHLYGSRKEAKICSDSNAKNVITKIELTTTSAVQGPKDDKHEDAKGNFDRSVPLPAWLKDAFPAIDLDTGIVYEAALDVARTQAWVLNLNNHENQPGEPAVIMSFWYKVTVEACDKNKDGTRTMWVSDPRGDNEGNH